MRNEEQGTRDNFIMGFSNPITESSAESVDKADGQVTVLSYRPLPEDGQKDGIKGKLEFLGCCLCHSKGVKRQLKDLDLPHSCLEISAVKLLY